MQIYFEYSPSILQRAYELHYKRFYPFRGRLMQVLGFLLIWTGILLFLILGEEGNKFISVSLVAYGLLVILLHWWLTRRMGARAYKKLDNLKSPLSINITPEGLTIRIQSQSQFISWDRVQKAVIYRDIVLLYFSERLFYIFPGESFSENDFESFKLMIREKVEKIF